eukprot:CCRYP_012676-RA/>CCRYP_012676-RA protein AED:0.38 eAED:0.38 QI:258/1/1/1/1/1/2/1959/330
MTKIEFLAVALGAIECQMAFGGSSSACFVSNHPYNFIQPRHHLPCHTLFASKRNSAGAKSKFQKKQYSLESLISLEDELRTRGYQYIIGSDDAGGAGCIAGPVVVASCCLMQPPFSFLSLSTDQSSTVPSEVIGIMSKVNDSKVLTYFQRQEIYETVISRPDLFAVSIAHRSPEEIDKVNLLRATQFAFAESIENLVSKYDLPHEKVYAIVDGNLSPKLYASERASRSLIESDRQNNPNQEATQVSLEEMKIFPVRPYVNADAEVYTVALASIIARVSREHIMTQLHQQYPAYGLDRNMGRGSRDHIEALHRHGAVDGVHRFSFKQVKGR